MIKTNYIIPIIVLIVISSLAIIVYNTHMLMKNVEAFSDFRETCDKMSCIPKYTNRCPPKAPKADVKEYSKSHRYYNFRDMEDVNPLLLLGCLIANFSNDILYKLNDICYTTFQEFDVVSKGSKYKIYEKILEDIRKTKGSNELLLDPVYTIIYENADEKGEEYEKHVKLIMIYPKYPKQCDKQDKKLQVFFNQYLYSSQNRNCTATLYEINKDHKMFYDLMQKKLYATL